MGFLPHWIVNKALRYIIKANKNTSIKIKTVIIKPCFLTPLIGVNVCEVFSLFSAKKAVIVSII